MQSSSINLSEKDSSILSINVQTPGVYGRSQSIEFRFYSSNSMVSVLQDMNGAQSSLSYGQATQLAKDLFDRFHFPVEVEKKRKALCFTQPHGFTECTFKDKDGNLQLREGVDPDLFWAVTALKIHDLSKYREMIQFLSDKGFISVDDRASLNPFITNIEKQLEFAKQLTEQVTQAQKDIIVAMCTPYIEAILEDCENKAVDESALIGKATWTKIDPSMKPLNKRDVALCVIFQAMQSGVATLFLEEFEGLKENCSESAQALEKIFNGCGDLESAFRQNGTGVPLLVKQRAVICSLCEEKLTERFGPEKDPQKKGADLKLLQTLRSRLLCDGYHLKCVRIANQLLTLNPFNAVFDALDGNFIYWGTPDGLVLKGPAAQERFLKIKGEVEKELNRSE